MRRKRPVGHLLAGTPNGAARMTPPLLATAANAAPQPRPRLSLAQGV
jgi:hypothetical protein